MNDRFTKRLIKISFKIMKKIKGPTAMYCNKFLNRSGQFWERESFDMYVRNEKMLNNVISYILQNPVKAGIVKHWEDFNGNYLKIDSQSIMVFV